MAPLFPFNPFAREAFRSGDFGSANSAASPRHILVIDDDPEILEIIAVLLKGDGHRVDTACDGGAGWVALCANAYDLLITDHMMARITGLDLLRRVRAVPLELPCILLSGAIPWEAEDLPRLLQPGAAVEKPFSLLDLRATVRELLCRIPAEQEDPVGNGLQLSPCP